MRHPTCWTTTGRSSVLVVAIAFCLTIWPINCVDQSVFVWGLNAGYPAICDREYRTKYFNTQKHREAVLAGLLFVPPNFILEEATKVPLRSNEDNFSANPLASEDDYTSEFLPIDHDYGTPGYVIYADSEPSDFMNDDDPPSQQIDGIKTLPRNSSDTSDGDFEKKLNPKGRNQRGQKLRKKIHRKKVADGKTAGKLVERKIRNRIRRKKVADGKTDEKLNERKVRREVRRNSFNLDEDDDRDRFYKVMDTFGPFYDSRRFGFDFETEVSNAHWSQDNCKSLRRIVAGYSVESPEVLPYMAFVDSGCGGAIISNMWVLTAGHCVDSDEPMYVHVGSIKLMTGCQYSIVHIYIHPKFSRKNLEHDVALLKVSPAFIFSPAIKPIALSSKRALRKSCGVVAGWGAEEYKGAPRMILSMTTIPIIARKKCRKLGIRMSQFCAGYDDASSDTCQGDSGSPFVVDGVVVGIVSFGHKCARPHTPGVYVDVFFHRAWIRRITGF